MGEDFLFCRELPADWAAWPESDRLFCWEAWASAGDGLVPGLWRLPLWLSARGLREPSSRIEQVGFVLAGGAVIGKEALRQAASSRDFVRAAPRWAAALQSHVSPDVATLYAALMREALGQVGVQARIQAWDRLMGGSAFAAAVGAPPEVAAAGEEEWSGLLRYALESFRRHCPHLAQPLRMTRLRQSHFRARLKELAEPPFCLKQRQDLQRFWDDFFARVAASDWLSGRSGDFRASFDWTILPNNFLKILEGRYDNRHSVPADVSEGFRRFLRAYPNKTDVARAWGFWRQHGLEQHAEDVVQHLRSMLSVRDAKFFRSAYGFLQDYQASVCALS